ncbi:hypothetical protein AB0E77_27685 [Streptomyces sp. NPDC032940]|uniref:hypothetical protein n=1 Tax=Streptomyces sp. NPDC032940 TaxID=3155366 RepID=UPI0033F363B2
MTGGATTGGRGAAASATGPGLRLNVTYGSWELVWAHVHRVLVVNLGMAAANLPLLAALQVSHQPWRHPLVFGPLLLLTGPSLAAAFACLEGTGDETPTVRAYARAYRRHFRRASSVSAVFLPVAAVAVADIAFLGPTTAGPALVPMAAVVAVLALLSAVAALARVAAGAASGRGILLSAPFAVVRHWRASAVNLVLITAGLHLVNQAPLPGLAVLPGCVLFVVRRNWRWEPDAGRQR